MLPAVLVLFRCCYCCLLPQTGLAVVVLSFYAHACLRHTRDCRRLAPRVFLLLSCILTILTFLLLFPLENFLCL